MFTKYITKIDGARRVSKEFRYLTKALFLLFFVLLLNLRLTSSVFASTTVSTDITTDGKIGIGNTSPASMLDVSGAMIGKALVSFNETGDQNIFTASASGITKFILGRTGNLSLTTGSDIRPLTDSTSALNIGNAAGADFVTFDTTNSRVGIGTTSPSVTFDMVGQSKFTGSSYPVFNLVRNVANGANSLYGVSKFVLNQADNAAGGGGTYYLANNSNGTAANAAYIGAGLSTTTAGSEIGFVLLKAAYHNGDPGASLVDTYGLKLVAAGNKTDTAYFNGNVFMGVNSASAATALEVNGGARLNTTKAKPTCDSTQRGTFWVTQGAAGVKDNVEVCAKDATDAYAWRTLY